MYICNTDSRFDRCGSFVLLIVVLRFPFVILTGFWGIPGAGPSNLVESVSASLSELLGSSSVAVLSDDLVLSFAIGTNIGLLSTTNHPLA